MAEDGSGLVDDRPPPGASGFVLVLSVVMSHNETLHCNTTNLLDV